MKLEVGSVCDRGLSSKRPVNEDRALVRSDRGLFVVCDGVGGHNSGEVASQMAIDTIEEALDNAGPTGSSEDIVELLQRAVQYANRDIYETAINRQEYDGMATTVALLYLDEARRRAIIGHAGDSRVYRFDGTRLHRETYDHTDLDDAIRAGALTPEQARAMGKQNTINRALGIENVVQAEFKTVPLGDSDSFLLCSDGVTRHIADVELEEILSDGLAPEAACEEIRTRCYSRGAEDNLTAIVVCRGARPLRARAKQAAGQRFEVSVSKPESGSAETATPKRSGLGLVAGSLLVALAAAAGFVAGQISPEIAPLRELGDPLPAAREAYERGDLPTARAAFAELSAREPSRADYQLWLGRIAAREGDADVAVRHLERAVNLDPALEDAYPALAGAYVLAGRPELAAEVLQRYDALSKENEARRSGKAAP